MVVVACLPSYPWRKLGWLIGVVFSFMFVWLFGWVEEGAAKG